MTNPAARKDPERWAATTFWYVACYTESGACPSIYESNWFMMPVGSEGSTEPFAEDKIPRVMLFNRDNVRSDIQERNYPFSADYVALVLRGHTNRIQRYESIAFANARQYKRFVESLSYPQSQIKDDHATVYGWGFKNYYEAMAQAKASAEIPDLGNNGSPYEIDIRVNMRGKS